MPGGQAVRAGATLPTMSYRLLVPFLLLSSLLTGCVAVAVTGAAVGVAASAAGAAVDVAAAGVKVGAAGVKAGARAIGSVAGSD